MAWRRLGIAKLIEDAVFFQGTRINEVQYYEARVILSCSGTDTFDLLFSKTAMPDQTGIFTSAFKRRQKSKNAKKKMATLGTA